MHKLKPKMKTYQANVREAGGKAKTFNGYKFNTGFSNKTNGNNAYYQRQPINTNLYCIFCKQIDSHCFGWCKVRKHSMKVKEQKCLKHNCCFSCLKTTDYKSDSCPDRRECRLCKKYHHFNLHPRLDIIKFYQEEKGNVGRQ